MPTFELENRFRGSIAGIDEVGRGSWWGPVYAACVLLSRQQYPAHLDDSKKIPEGRREKIFEDLETFRQRGLVYYGVAKVEASEIDRLNIRNATKMAMAMAYENLCQQYQKPIDMVLVDGDFVPAIETSSLAVIGGDALSYSIAAASIVAKVLRDRELRQKSFLYPIYQLDKNKGYGTRAHEMAIRQCGLVEGQHRRSFCKKFL
jgi:ribonuclease HII